MIITFNYKNGTKTITFADLEKSGLSSDLTAHALPRENRHPHGCLFFSSIEEDKDSKNTYYGFMMQLNP